MVRQLGREVARAVGLEAQDQIRIATALSEVGRLMLAAGRDTDVDVRGGGRCGYPLCGWTWNTRCRAAPLRLAAAAGAGRPPGRHDGGRRWRNRYGRADVSTAAGERAAPDRGPRWTRFAPDWRPHVPGTPLDELAVQNQQLIAALDEVRAQRDDLARLNAELEETNRGVMALYHQLSDELEETNRGVVALYAELDEKSRAAARGQRGEEPVPGQRQPRAARAGDRDHRARAAARPTRPPIRSPPSRRRQVELIRELRRGPAVAGQRPARSGQGGGRPDRADLGRGRPAGRSSASCAAPCGRWPPGPRWSFVVEEPAGAACCAPTRCCSPRCCATC